MTIPDELQQSAARLHALGPQPLAYFLAEIAEGRDFHETLSRYAAMDPEVVRALGADSVDAEATAERTRTRLRSTTGMRVKGKAGPLMRATGLIYSQRQPRR